MSHIIYLFQSPAGSWHVPSILMVTSWLVSFVVTGAFMYATLKVNRDDRIAAYQKEQQSAVEVKKAHDRIEELEEAKRPRIISKEQKDKFINLTKNGPFGPVVLATYSALPSKEQENFTMQLRHMLDEAGFGISKGDIVNGFNTEVESEKHLVFVSKSNAPPNYYSNLGSALYEIGLISPDIPVAVNNPNAKEGLLYLFIPEK